MQHIDQKILELYVLNDESIAQQRNMIEQHLDECAGCRELHARMEEMYSGFFADMESEKQEMTSANLSGKVRKSLVRQHTSPLQEIRANYEIERGPIRRVMLFARRHPVVTSTMSLFIIGFFALLGWQVFNSVERIDENPSYYRYSPDSKLEVYNKENLLLWNIPGHHLYDYDKNEQIGKNSRTFIADLNNDNINEVISSLPFINDNIPSEKITVFNSKGDIVKSVKIPDKEFHFRNLFYDRSFIAGSLLAYKTSKNETNIFIHAGSGRSPNYFARLDSNLNFIGKYWHFGNFNMYKTILQNEDVIFLYGKNDVEDISMGDFPFIAVIAPEKLDGDEESSTSTGFGHKKSISEIYYLRFPETDMEKVLKTKSGVTQIVYDDTSKIYFHVENFGKTEDPRYVGFDYILSKSDMHIIGVKYSSVTARNHQKMKAEGKIQTTFNEEYLVGLKNRVEYWDGTKWVRKPTRIVHNY